MPVDLIGPFGGLGFMFWGIPHGLRFQGQHVVVDVDGPDAVESQVLGRTLTSTCGYAGIFETGVLRDTGIHRDCFGFKPDKRDVYTAMPVP